MGFSMLRILIESAAGGMWCVSKASGLCRDIEWHCIGQRGDHGRTQFARAEQSVSAADAQWSIDKMELNI